MRSRAVVSRCEVQKKKATMMMPLAIVPTTLVRQFTDAIRMNSHIGKTVASGRSPVSLGKGFEMFKRVSLPKAMPCFSRKSFILCNSVILQIDCFFKHFYNENSFVLFKIPLLQLGLRMLFCVFHCKEILWNYED